MLAMPPVPLGNNIPPQESAAGAVGSADSAAVANHSHPTISWRTNVTLDGSGMSAVNFGRTFAAKPPVFLTAINPAGRPVMLEIVSYIESPPGTYTGVNIRGYRSQLLPALSGILLLGPLLTALGNFDIFGGSAASVEVCLIALVPS